MSLKQKTTLGVLWTSGGKFVSLFLQFAITIFLVRTLTPRDFGYLAMAMVFIGFAQKFNDLGFGSALIQHKTIRTRHASSVFWINLMLGFFTGAVFWLAAPFISNFYGEPELNSITRVLSIIFIFHATEFVPNALLQRQMRFNKIAIIEIASVGISGVVALYMAFTGWGVWSLVAQLLIKSLTSSFLSWVFVQWLPRFWISRIAIKEILGFSLGYSGFHFINYWARKIDDLLVGRLMGTHALGIYDRAYQLMLHPVTIIIEVISKVMFPALSKIKDQHLRVKRIYLLTIAILAFAIFPMMAGLFVVGEPFVITVFGEQWIEVAGIIAILCPVGMIQALCIPTGWIYTSQGRTDWMFWWGVGGAGFLIIALSIGAYFGTVQSVAYSYLIANIILMYPCIAISGKLINLKFVEVIHKVWAPFACSLAMAAIVFYVSLQLPETWSYLNELLVLIPLGIVAYIVINLIAKIEAGQHFLRLLLEQWEKFRNSDPSIKSGHEE